jgi:hypothetical protein
LQDEYEQLVQNLDKKTAKILAQATTLQQHEEEPWLVSPATRQSCPQLPMTSARAPSVQAANPPSSPGFESVLQQVAEVVSVSPS